MNFKPMTNTHLQAWLDQDDRELVDAIASEIRQHVTTLQANGDKFYGYAILPGQSYAISNLVAVFNRESDIAPENAADNYYRYSVDEWANYEYDKFPISNKLIDARNAHFKETHVKDDPENFYMDDYEVAHVEKLLDTLLKAMIELRRDGTFGAGQSFAVIWMSDSGHSIMYESAKALNSNEEYDTFMKEFGD